MVATPTLNTPVTARDFITLAMKEAGVLGVGQSLLAEDINDGFTYLQRMLKQWQNQRWMVNALQDISLIPTSGNASETIGNGGTWNIYPKPSRINAGYFFQINTGQTPITLPLAPIFSYEDYARITVKKLNTQPEFFFYDNQNNGVNGLGNVFIWPIPTPSTYEIHLIVQAGLGWPTTVDAIYYLPDEYAEAIHYNLAVRLCSAYGIEPKQSTMMLAKSSRNTIRNANTQVPELMMPSGLRNGKAFSIYNPDGY